MDKNLFTTNSVEQAVMAATETAIIPKVVGAEEIVLYDECGDTMWDKVLAQHNLVNTVNQQLPG